MKRGQHKKTSKIQKRENGLKYFKASAFPAYTAIAGGKRTKLRKKTRKTRANTTAKATKKSGKKYIDLKRYMNISNVAIA